MPTYATTADFINAFGQREIVQVTNLWEPGASAINTALLRQNQEKAFSLINGMIAQCPGVAALMPFSPPFPSLLVGYELDLTRYFMDSLEPREDVRRRYEDAIAQLKLIGKCELSLGLVGSPPTVAESSPGSADYFADAPVFDTNFLSGF